MIASNMDTIGTFEMAIALGKVSVSLICFMYFNWIFIHNAKKVRYSPIILHCLIL